MPMRGIHANHPSGARRLKALQRQKECLQLRLAGMTFADIGEALGISRAAVQKAVGKAMETYRAEVACSVEDLRAASLARLNTLRTAIWKAATSGKELEATALALKLEEREARLLGLDMPTKIAPTDSSGDIPLPSSPFGQVAQIIYLFPPNGRDELTPEEKANAIEHDPGQG